MIVYFDSLVDSGWGTETHTLMYLIYNTILRVEARTIQGKTLQSLFLRMATLWGMPKTETHTARQGV